jgi:hypothetical protein
MGIARIDAGSGADQGAHDLDRIHLRCRVKRRPTIVVLGVGVRADPSRRVTSVTAPSPAA